LDAVCENFHRVLTRSFFCPCLWRKGEELHGKLRTIRSVSTETADFDESRSGFWLDPCIAETARSCSDCSSKCLAARETLIRTELTFACTCAWTEIGRDVIPFGLGFHETASLGRRGDRSWVYEKKSPSLSMILALLITATTWCGVDWILTSGRAGGQHGRLDFSWSDLATAVGSHKICWSYW
jgi:hypothetical protein